MSKYNRKEKKEYDEKLKRCDNCHKPIKHFEYVPMVNKTFRMCSKCSRKLNNELK